MTKPDRSAYLRLIRHLNALDHPVFKRRTYARRVAIHIASHLNSNPDDSNWGRCNPTQAYVAEELGIWRESVNRIVTALADPNKGIGLETTEAIIPGTNRTSLHYYWGNVLDGMPPRYRGQGNHQVIWPDITKTADAQIQKAESAWQQELEDMSVDRDANSFEFSRACALLGSMMEGYPDELAAANVGYLKSNPEIATFMGEWVDLTHEKDWAIDLKRLHANKQKFLSEQAGVIQ